ncbi:FAD-dependent oxidoreductase [Palleronia caenipelagi]|uniref:FAD-binding oxidoreductase n=1 Tax=Palleronia caenipelagi TaxID=2489174 RepID=A0A547PNB8_9RHOB|nr:FAD-dependent oxidoreductase [Palleronia caenipelagi]TRD15605.1 FAD-binding oxidoreductase [Palleronia caenipelagi]
MSSLRLDRDGRLIIGGVGNIAGPQGAVHRSWPARKLAQIYPELAGTPFEHEWSGAIAMISDHLPKVVSIGPRALSIYGYSGRGIGPGTVFGRAAARALLHGDPTALPLAIAQRRSERFRTLRTLSYEVGATAMHAIRTRRHPFTE